MIGKAERERLQFLGRVVERECHHLLTTDQRLFTLPFTTDRAAALADNADEAERVDAFANEAQGFPEPRVGTARLTAGQPQREHPGSGSARYRR